MGGTMYIAGLQDGSVLVIAGFSAPEAEPSTPDQGTLSMPGEAYEWISGVILSGVTFDVLKAITARLLTEGWSRRARTVDADEATAVVRRYLQSQGYLELEVTEVRKVDGSGWTVKGTADDTKFRAIADLQGAIVHVRVG
jgi:hypothetical protein